MAASQSRSGRLAAILQRLKMKRLRGRIATGVDYAISSTVSLLSCLFAAEVAVGRRVTRRDPETLRRQESPAAHHETTVLSTPVEQLEESSGYAARCVEFFGRPAGSCPVNGGRLSSGRGRKSVIGRARSIRFPGCKYRRAASRFSKVTVQNWLKLHQPPASRSRRHRPS